VTDHEGIRQKSFWADHDSGEAQMFMDMLDYLRHYLAHTILHYGAYEARALKRVHPKIPSKYAEELECLLKRMVNILSVIGPHIYFPVYSNSLKEVAEFLSHRWSVPGASGAQAVLWRQQWNDNHDDVIKDKLIRYNMDDCFGLKVVVTFIDQIAKSLSDPSVNSTLFVHTDHLEKELGSAR
jgi:predicted RecB family nuclease